MNTLKKTVSFLCALLLTLPLAACASEPADNGAADTTAADTETAETTAEPEFVYEYAEADFEGEDFVMLNTAQTYGFYSNLDFEEATGDALDDAIYERNRKVEEIYNLKFVVNEEHQTSNAHVAFQNAVLAGDSAYDVAFLRDSWCASPLTQGMMVDMQNIENFNFDQPWWDVEAIENIRIGTKEAIYYAYSDTSFTDFEGTLCIFFNEDIFEDYGIDAPYDTVRDGKWTFEEMRKIMKAGANLNGQDTFGWQTDGTAMYGLCSWDEALHGMFFGLGYDYIEIKDGQPYLPEYTSDYITKMQTILEMMLVDGEYLLLNGSGNDHYEMAFKNGRTLMIASQLKATNKYRDMDDSFGILPMPKADEAQENYRCMRSYSYVLTMPVTNTKHEETAAVMDAMSYITYDTVVDDFLEGRVCEKSLRNKESVEMLSIIRDSRVMDIGAAYGFTAKIKSAYYSCFQNKTTDIMSSLDSVLPGVEIEIENVMKMLNEN